MDKWIETASKNGITALALIALAWFLYKKIWPLIEKRLNDADIERKDNLQRFEEQGKAFTLALEKHREADERRFGEQGRLFTEALRTQNVFAAETHKESMAAHNRLADKLEVMDQHLRNGNGK